jgi:hypothetical protein
VKGEYAFDILGGEVAGEWRRGGRTSANASKKSFEYFKILPLGSFFR